MAKITKTILLAARTLKVINSREQKTKRNIHQHNIVALNNNEWCKVLFFMNEI
jgi:hypothetical protein